MKKNYFPKVPVGLLVINKETGKQEEIQAEQYPNSTLKVWMIIIPNAEIETWLDIAGYKFLKLIDKVKT